ncbi:hypothetical protein LSH36_120g16024 [Paralvinella palmiformis]|uniref:G-protein coupled receptors family 1 profile domain-containing protein n=1 Tax=Paralvinella palmiformis TaxID=53620 RepID=A0AAD9JXK5_9ANNE|nr:hypothetical protein LSH36_120g16024 [Paralvinella palmiformis]
MCAMRAHLVERRAYVFIIVVWILSIGVSAPILFYRREYKRIWADHVEIWCADNWPLSTDGSTAGVARRTYYTLVSLVLFFIPIAVMSVAYLLIIYKLWSRMPPGEVIDCDVSAQVRVKRKVVLMLMTILSVFAVCWLPLQVSILYAEHRPDVNESKLPLWYDDFNYFATFLAYSNSAINPIIYTCFNENYRKAFKEVFSCGKRNHPHMNGHRYSYNSVEMRTQQDRQTEVTCTQILHSPNLPKKCEVLAKL